ncbi:MAG: hypothetical protein K2J20_04410 [Bacilli bacterium]|nr:hypothetical protein [Bacilli bacterium]
MDSNVERCLLVVKEVELFCNLYHIWPRRQQVISNKIKEQSENLYNKLFGIGYIGNSDFIGYAVKTDSGEFAIDVLDRLYEKYSTKKSKNMIARKVTDVVGYCRQYCEWPELIPNPETEQQIKSNRCRKWLDDNHYVPFDASSFNYRNLKDANGKLVCEVFDNLYVEMEMQDGMAPDEMLNGVDEVVNYCELYHEWPTKIENPFSDKDILGNKLANWLDVNFFSSNQYLDTKYIKKLTVKDVLERYYFTYSAAGSNNSDDESFFLYKEIIQKSHYMFLSYEAYMEFQRIILEEISKWGLDIDFYTIAADIAFPIKERVEECQCKYQYFNEKGDTYLAKLYYNLYMYFFILERVSFFGSERKRKIIKGK